jgi:ATP-binding cassette subfamily B protein
MDCGPAALKCLLDGFGLPASYGRLREACQTDVDGTSIDTLEDLANDVGLIAEQIMLPIDHVIASAASVLPAIAVVRQPGGILHFIVAWRRHGPVVQVMDPATGRRWPGCRAFADELYPHTMSIAAAAWRTWADSNLFHDGLRARAATCGVGRRAIDELTIEAAKDKGWTAFAALDSTLRMMSALRRSGGVSRSDADRTLEKLWERTCSASDPTAVVPADYWTVRPAPASDDVLVKGAVLVTVRGRRAAEDRQQREAALPREVAAALRETPPHPGRHLWSLIRADGDFAPAALLAALFFAATGVLVEALLFRSLMDLGTHLSLTGQRLGAMAIVIALAALLLFLELPIATLTLGLGRRLETRLRAAFLAKIPRLADRYFQSRPSSDMAERAHAAHQIRELPTLGARLARSTFELVFTTAGIAFVYPQAATAAVAAALTTLAIPAVAQPWLRERDLRQRTHSGALTRFYLDAFLGLVPIRAHAAERAVAREQEALLVDWVQAGRALLRTAVAANGVQLVAGFAFAAWLLFGRARLGDEGGGILLLAYWALNIPMLGQEIAQTAWQYPTQRNLTLRLLEPLGALEAEEPSVPVQGDRRARFPTAHGVSVDLRDVTVRAGGHAILEGSSLTIEPGAHVAIVGESGAGKSTLVGLLLGWHRPAAGVVLLDGKPLDAARLDEVRQQTAWVDPVVQIWNQSLIDNLEYGCHSDSNVATETRLGEADLRSAIEQLPEGLQTRLGEGGTLVSGGEGQRVRFGRGLGRPDARLVILDEPFRGLERERRSTLLKRARARWSHATLLCVTHDIAETADFDKVVVISNGRVVETGTPPDLVARPDSRYRSLLAAETSLRVRLWADPSWRTIRLDAGRVIADEAAPRGVRGPSIPSGDAAASGGRQVGT